MNDVDKTFANLHDSLLQQCCNAEGSAGLHGIVIGPGLQPSPLQRPLDCQTAPSAAVQASALRHDFFMAAFHSWHVWILHVVPDNSIVVCGRQREK